MLASPGPVLGIFQCQEVYSRVIRLSTIEGLAFLRDILVLSRLFNSDEIPLCQCRHILTSTIEGTGFLIPVYSAASHGNRRMGPRAQLWPRHAQRSLGLFADHHVRVMDGHPPGREPVNGPGHVEPLRLLCPRGNAGERDRPADQGQTVAEAASGPQWLELLDHETVISSS